MPFRLCPNSGQACECNATEMQPCLAGLIHKYFKELRGCVRNHVPVTDSGALRMRRNEINMIHIEFASKADLRRFIETGQR